MIYINKIAVCPLLTDPNEVQATKGLRRIRLQFLKEMEPSYVCFLLDSQISKSGLLAKVLRQKISASGLKGDAKTSKRADYDLKNSDYIVASSDGVVIDEAGKVVNFLYCLMSRFKHLGVELWSVDNINKIMSENHG